MMQVYIVTFQKKGRKKNKAYNCKTCGLTCLDYEKTKGAGPLDHQSIVGPGRPVLLNTMFYSQTLIFDYLYSQLSPC